MFYLFNSLIIITSLIPLIKYKTRPYSLFKMVHLFMLFFMGVAPLIQYNNNVQLWGGESFSEYDYELSSLIILLISILYSITYIYFNNKSVKDVCLYNSCIKVSKVGIDRQVVAIAVSVICVGIVFYLNNFNIYKMLFRGGELTANDVESESRGLLGLTFSHLVRPVPFIILLFLLLKGYSSKILLIISFCLGLLAVFPTSMARFSIAAFYIPLFVLIFDKTLKKPFTFILSFVFGLLLVFPFLNNFRYFSFDSNISISLNYDMFMEGHFDAFQMFMRVIKYDVISYGRQFLGVLLFYVPRSIWVNKPVGSGYYLAENLNLDFNNISMPFWGEAFMNFGYLGIFLCVFILAFITSKLDTLYWSKWIKENSNKSMYYLLLIGLVFFIMRGDLLSSISFTIGILVSVKLVEKMLNL